MPSWPGARPIGHRAKLVIALTLAAGYVWGVWGGAAIDQAVGDDAFRLSAMTRSRSSSLHRLSSLVPFSLNNYVLGVSAVKLLHEVVARA